MIKKANKILFCILIIICSIPVRASDKEIVIESSLKQIQDSYADFYLTYKGSIKAWYGKTLSKLGINLSKDLEGYVERKETFESSVRSYNMFVGDYSLNLSLSPIEFKAAFNNEVKNRLGGNILKKLNLDIDKKYPVPGE